VIGWLLWARLASAGIDVDDVVGCVDEERVRLEVGRVLDSLDRADADVSVRLADDGLSVVARRQRRVLWERTLPVGRADCDAVPEVVARSVEQGLSGLPDWQFEGDEGLPPDVGVFLEAAASPVPDPLSWGVLGLGTGPLGRTGRWAAGLSLVAIPVGDGTGRGAQLLTPQVRFGPGTDLGRRRRWRAMGCVSAGPVFVVPRATLQLSGPRLVPAARADVALQWRSPGSLAVSLFVDSPLVRVVVVDDAVPQRLEEGLIRVGLRLGVAGSLRAR